MRHVGDVEVFVVRDDMSFVSDRSRLLDLDVALGLFDCETFLLLLLLCFQFS
jgi:hypothetical protein